MSPDTITAPPRPSAAPRVWAAALLLAAALVLVGLAGCFFLGDLIIADPAVFYPCPDPGTPLPTPSWGPANIFLFAALGAAAFCCLAGAAVAGWRGFLGLNRELFGRADLSEGC